MNNIMVFAFPTNIQQDSFQDQKKKRRRRQKSIQSILEKKNIEIKWAFDEKFMLSFD